MPHHDSLDPVALNQRGHFAAQGGVPKHDDARDAVAEVGRRKQLSVGDDEVRAEVRATRDLRKEWGAEFARDLFRAFACARARDDDGAREGAQLELRAGAQGIALRFCDASADPAVLGRLLRAYRNPAVTGCR
jgi:hypothetical protein